MKIMLKAATMVAILALTGCVTIEPKVAPYVTYGGSKSDGTVKLGYRHPAGVAYRGDSDQGLTLAKQVCAGWGYKSAAPFGQSNQGCHSRAKQEWIGCVIAEVTQDYQCLSN